MTLDAPRDRAAAGSVACCLRFRRPLATSPMPRSVRQDVSEDSLAVFPDKHRQGMATVHATVLSCFR